MGKSEGISPLNVTEKYQGLVTAEKYKATSLQQQSVIVMPHLH